MVTHLHRAAIALAVVAASLATQADSEHSHDRIEHVLLISVDGLHAVDLANYVQTHPQSALAELSRHGVTYTNAFSSTPSDSFPGLAALVTGGSPTTTGFWYDVTWNRAVAPQETGNPIMGTSGGNCPGTVGAVVELDEGADNDLTRLDAGGGINPMYLPRDATTCKPIYPHDYLRVNTIFEVVHAHGGLTAWTDKHPSYEWTNGPSGHGVDDFYGPEINSIPVALPYPGCSPVPYADPTPDDGWTTSFANIMCYDSTHVQAVLNQIDGYTHDRGKHVGVPALFGTNFQAVSVGEKLKTDPVTGALGGYADVLATPNVGLAEELDFVDRSLGSMVGELKSAGVYDSTLIIVGAKHGQSPIDLSKRRGIGGGQPAAAVGQAWAFDISDDGSLIWLKDPSLTAGVVHSLSQNQQALGIQEIFAGNLLRDKFNSPSQDPRTPDIILKVDTGVIFTGGSKIAEHGGFNEDDVHTALLVSNPRLTAASVNAAVSNQQVAATVVKALGYDPRELKAVQKDDIHVLPFLFDHDRDHD
jgi:Type I phosphodiesterase / nucleotide pyrophosphatase